MWFILFSVIALGAFIIWRSAARKLAERNIAFRGLGGLAGVVMLVCVLLALLQCFTVIPAGHVGVVDFFGYVSDRAFTAGINFVNPLALMNPQPFVPAGTASASGLEGDPTRRANAVAAGLPPPADYTEFGQTTLADQCAFYR